MNPLSRDFEPNQQELLQSLYVRRLIRHIMTSIHYQNLDYSVFFRPWTLLQI
jgi:hypothetical protein